MKNGLIPVCAALLLFAAGAAQAQKTAGLAAVQELAAPAGNCDVKVNGKIIKTVTAKDRNDCYNQTSFGSENCKVYASYFGPGNNLLEQYFNKTDRVNSDNCKGAATAACEVKSNGILIVGFSTFKSPAECLANPNYFKENICNNIKNNPGQFPPGKVYPYTITYAGGLIGKGECGTAGPGGYPDQGDNSKCEKKVVVGGMHYPQQSCAQSKADFLSKAMTSYHLTSKCVPAKLLGVSAISCQDAPIPGFPTGSVYTATSCCGPAAATPTGWSGGAYATACPPAGSTYDRAGTLAAFSGIHLAHTANPGSMDDGCAAAKAGSKMSGFKVTSCSGGPTQIYFQNAVVTCTP